MNIHEPDGASGSSSVPVEALMSVTIGGQWRTLVTISWCTGHYSSPDEVVSSSSEAESDQVSPHVWHYWYLTHHMTTQSDGELSEDGKSDSETEVAMDTAEHVPQQLT